jgi:predicted site-specific integrase-resolvase
MKLSTWARENGLSYRTAWRVVHTKTLPVEAEQLATGTIIVKTRTDGEKAKGVALYARVSSANQKHDLDPQVAPLLAYAVKKKLPIAQSVTEIGSAINGRRTRLMKLLRDNSIGFIVVEHRDRLTRFGFEYLEAALAGQGRRIMVVDESEVKEDMVREMTAAD